MAADNLVPCAPRRHALIMWVKHNHTVTGGEFQQPLPFPCRANIKCQCMLLVSSTRKMSTQNTERKYTPKKSTRISCVVVFCCFCTGHFTLFKTEPKWGSFEDNSRVACALRSLSAHMTWLWWCLGFLPALWSHRCVSESRPCLLHCPQWTVAGPPWHSSGLYRTH